MTHFLQAYRPFGIAWAATWIIASVVYRRWSGKPFLRPRFDRPAFLETWRSGRSRRNLLTRIGGANKCLWVAVHEGRVRIGPHFPFNLMFLPEIYRLEMAVPGAAVLSVERRPSGFDPAIVRLRVQHASGDDEEFDISCRDPQAFVDAVMAIRPA